MSYELKPVNGSVGRFSVNCSGWEQLLNNGIGLVLGTGPAFAPGTFVYERRPDGLCVWDNDGAKVTREEAIEMANIARRVARLQQIRINQWRNVDLDAMAATKEHFHPWSQGDVALFLKFAEWAEKSGGFAIH